MICCTTRGIQLFQVSDLYKISSLWLIHFLCTDSVTDGKKKNETKRVSSGEWNLKNVYYHLKYNSCCNICNVKRPLGQIKWHTTVKCFMQNKTVLFLILPIIRLVISMNLFFLLHSVLLHKYGLSTDNSAPKLG